MKGNNYFEHKIEKSEECVRTPFNFKANIDENKIFFLEINTEHKSN